MFQIENMEPEFQKILTKRVLELKTRLTYSVEDGNISSSLLQDLSALLKWSAKIGLLGESEFTNVQNNLNIVQKRTNPVRSQLLSLVHDTNPKCLIEMTCQNKSTQTIKASKNYGTEQIIVHTIAKRCINKQTRIKFAVENQITNNNNWIKSLDDASSKSFIRIINSTKIININGGNKYWRAKTLSTKSPRKQWSTNRISSTRDRQKQGKWINWSNKSPFEKWKIKLTSNRYVLPCVCKIVGHIKIYKIQNRFYDRGKGFQNELLFSLLGFQSNMITSSQKIITHKLFYLKHNETNESYLLIIGINHSSMLQLLLMQ